MANSLFVQKTYTKPRSVHLGGGFQLTWNLCSPQNIYMKILSHLWTLKNLSWLSVALLAGCAVVAEIEGGDTPTHYTPDDSSSDPESEDTAETNSDSDSGFSADDESEADTSTSGTPSGTGGTGSETPSSTPTDSSPEVATDEPDTEFVCSDSLQCTIKWFGTICCDKRCINPATSVKHCGGCHNDCMADRRGNSCVLANCTCGLVPTVGCQGQAAGDCCTNLIFLWACNAC